MQKYRQSFSSAVYPHASRNSRSSRYKQDDVTRYLGQSRELLRDLLRLGVFVYIFAREDVKVGVEADQDDGEDGHDYVHVVLALAQLLDLQGVDVAHVQGARFDHADDAGPVLVVRAVVIVLLVRSRDLLFFVRAPTNIPISVGS